MKLVYVVQMGRGELSQAESFALYARKQGDENVFITDKVEFKRAMDQYAFTAYITKTPKDARHLIKQLSPDVVLHCSSKTTHMHSNSLLKNPPLSPKPFCASLDSNWLFSDDKRSPFRAPEWLDLIFVVIPGRIFEQGLAENGGHYQISDFFRPKIYNPGFIPSASKIGQARREEIRKQLGIKREEKLIFCYFGLKEDVLLPRFIQCLQQIVPFLNVKVFIKLCKQRHLLNADWLMTKVWLSSEEMVEYLASSDLVCQHHGLGTLPKAIANQVPALCITEEIKGECHPYDHSAAFEIIPFASLGLCRALHTYDFSPESLEEHIEVMLFDETQIRKMKNAQMKHFEAGEARAYDKLIQELKTGRG